MARIGEVRGQQGELCNPADDPQTAEKSPDIGFRPHVPHARQGMALHVMAHFMAENGCKLRFIVDTQQQRSEEHTSELQSLMRISYAVFCLKKKTNSKYTHKHTIKP